MSCLTLSSFAATTTSLELGRAESSACAALRRSRTRKVVTITMFCLTVSCWAMRFEMSFWSCSSDVRGLPVVMRLVAGGKVEMGMKRAGFSFTGLFLMG